MMNITPNKQDSMLHAVNFTISNLCRRFYSADAAITVLAMALGKLCQRHDIPVEDALDQAKQAHRMAEIYFNQQSS